MTTATSPFAEMQVDHVRFAVADAEAAAAPLVDGYGFVRVADGPVDPGARALVLRQGAIELVLTQPLRDDHPAVPYLRRHGDGVTDIALRVTDAAAAFRLAVARGAAPAASPSASSDGVVAAVAGFGDVTHTFVQRAQPPGPVGRLHTVDHFAVCLEAGQLAPTIEFYRSVLDFEPIFAERIVVGTQAMESTVVQSRSGAVTLTLIAPDTTRDAGQIDGFLADHGGPGVQHVAFATDDIVDAVGAFQARGITFLTTPPAYYRLLAERLRPARHTEPELAELGVLVDTDHDGQLFQIFSRSTHPRGTLFFEVIERCGAQLFGSGNIRALYEAVEAQQRRAAA